jgi:two-component system response regulator NreC
MSPIRILLADDHQMIRTGLKSFLESQHDFTVIAEASNGREAIERALESRPDIVLMDITMPEMDGLQATRQLKKLWSECVILCLTVHEDKFYFMEMLAAGAAGYLTKQAASDELVAAIHAVAQGHVYLQPALARWLLEDYQQLASKQETTGNESEAAVKLEVLSERERGVLEMVAQGLTNQQIGEKLELSPKTIARHRERIMSKLNLHTRVDLVRFAIGAGLVKIK